MSNRSDAAMGQEHQDMKATLPLRTVIACLWLLGTASAAAADAPLTANKFLEKRHAEVMTIINQSNPSAKVDDAKEQRLKSAIGDLLDFEELSRRALADHWNGLEDTKRQEFVALLAQLVERSYQKNLESIRNFQVQYDQAKHQGDSVLVHTVARSRKNRRAPAVEIDYTLFPRDGSYRVYDIATDGVSLVANYKRQFNKIIRRDGWNALLERMRKRLAEGSDDL